MSLNNEQLVKKIIKWINEDFNNIVFIFENEPPQFNNRRNFKKISSSNFVYECYSFFSTKPTLRKMKKYLDLSNYFVLESGNKYVVEFKEFETFIKSNNKTFFFKKYGKIKGTNYLEAHTLNMFYSSLRKYIGNVDFKIINDSLRKKKDDNVIRTQKLIKSLDDGFLKYAMTNENGIHNNNDKNIKFDNEGNMILWRGTRNSYDIDKKSIITQGYTSLTSNYEVALDYTFNVNTFKATKIEDKEEFNKEFEYEYNYDYDEWHFSGPIILCIKVKPDVPYVYVSERNEYEYILPRGLKFEINDSIETIVKQSSKQYAIVNATISLISPEQFKNSDKINCHDKTEYIVVKLKNTFDEFKNKEEYINTNVSPQSNNSPLYFSDLVNLSPDKTIDLIIPSSPHKSLHSTKRRYKLKKSLKKIVKNSTKKINSKFTPLKN